MVSGAKRLPDSWKLSTLGEIADLIGGGTPSREHPEYFTGDIVWLTPTEIPRNRVTVVSNSREKITQEGLKKSSARVMPKGTVLMTSRASIGYVAIAGTEVTTNQGFASFICKEDTNNHYLAYWLLGNADFFIQQATGTTFKEITKSKLRNFTIPVPPLPEQERIVAKIEELFTQLEAGTSALERVQAGLRRYKASVLKAAADGQLFGDVEISDDGLPVDWQWIKVKEAGKVQLGRQRAPQHHQGTHMRPYLRVANVFEDRIDLSDVKEMNFTPAEYEIYKLEYGDILLNEGQSPEYLGRPAMYKGELPGSCFQNTLIRFQAFDFVDRHFALLVFRHYMHAGRFAQESQITTNMAHLSAGRFGNVEFPLPPLEEQRRIVAEVERRLSVARQVESAVAVPLRKIT
jgi:restriction endonuclease S subunit